LKGEGKMKKLLIMFVCLSLILVGGNAFAQSASADADADATSESGASIDSNDTYNTYNRQFAPIGVTPLPQTNGFFTAPTPDSSFRSVKDLLRYTLDDNKFMVRFTEGAMEKLAKGGDVETHLQIIRGDEQVPRVYGDDFKDATENPRWLWVAIEEPVIKDGKVLGTKRFAGLRVTGFIDGESDDADTNSFQVIGKAGLKALKDGNNFMVITAEGAHRKVEAQGWGIGFYTSIATVSGSGKDSVAGGGGTGYAYNETGPEDRPWIQAYVGCKDMDFLNAQIAAYEASLAKPEADEQTGNHKD
jgi:hypothetical protein